MRCDYLHCHEQAVARVTVPHLKQRQCNCEGHLHETLAWAAKYRMHPGAVQVEQLADWNDWEWRHGEWRPKFNRYGERVE